MGCVVRSEATDEVNGTMGLENCLNAADRFLSHTGVPPHLPSDVVALFPSTLGRPVDAASPDIEHLITIYDGVSPGTYGLCDIAYAQYLGMCAYAAADMWSGRSVGERIDDLIARGEWALGEREEMPRSRVFVGELQCSLFRSLLKWKKVMPLPAQAIAGEYLAHVHLHHAKKYDRVFRAEFVVACAWQGTASWASPHVGVYASLSLMGYDAIAEVVRWASERQLSPIRVLADDQCYRFSDDKTICGAMWFDGPTVPEADEEVLPMIYLDVPSELEMLIGDENEERRLNVSLITVFGSERDVGESKELE